MRRRRLTLVAIGLVATASLAWMGGASAAPRGQGAERSSHDRIEAYWTPTRRAHAIPRDVVLPSTRAKGGKPGKPGGGGGGGGIGGVVTGATWTGGGSVVKTTGKVYFSMGQSNYVCSGSAIAGNVNLVLTAGHCVWDDADGFATNWMFWPAYDNGSKPYGTWTASALFTTVGWHDAGNRDFPNDAGLAVVADGAGGELPGVLGQLPSMGGSTNATVTTVLGLRLPGGEEVQGRDPHLLPGPGEIGYYDGDGHGLDGLRHDRWIVRWTVVRRLGWTAELITSLNSYGYGGLNRMFGPTFDGQEAAAFTAADDGVCSSGEVCATQ